MRRLETFVDFFYLVMLELKRAYAISSNRAGKAVKRLTLNCDDLLEFARIVTKKQSQF